MARQLKNLVINSWGKTQALTESLSLDQGLDFLAKPGDNREAVHIFPCLMPPHLSEVDLRLSQSLLNQYGRNMFSASFFLVESKVYKGRHLSCLLPSVSPLLSNAWHYVGIDSCYYCFTQGRHCGIQDRMSLRPLFQV